MVRSGWKIPYICNSLLLKGLIYNKDQDCYVFSRNSIIPNFLVNKRIKVYTGKNFLRILIRFKMIGFRFGQFVFTKKRGKIVW